MDSPKRKWNAKIMARSFYNSLSIYILLLGTISLDSKNFLALNFMTDNFLFSSDYSLISYIYIELLHKIWKSSITFSLNAAIVGHKSQKSNSTMISWNFFLLQIICEFEIYILHQICNSRKRNKLVHMYIVCRFWWEKMCSSHR